MPTVSGRPTRNLNLCFAPFREEVSESVTTVRVRGVTSYLNRYQRGLPDAHPALVSDSHAILAMKRESSATADSVTRWAARLAEVVTPLITADSILVSVPPSVPRRHLCGIQLVALVAARELGIHFLDDGLIRTAPIGNSISRNRRDTMIHQQTLAVNPDIAEHHVILVDDVLVSGTTMRVAAELLLSAGARQVDPISLAQACIVDHHYRDFAH